MPSSPESDAVLISRIRDGEEDAWSELIRRYEGRMLAYVDCRIGRRAVSEDVVQEAFIGFLNSLPNYDESRALENYLFSIAAHKLTDFLRREGRRPKLSLSSGADSGGWQLPGKGRPASSLMRSGERKGFERASLASALQTQVDRIRERGDWEKLSCLELLFVRGWANKAVAAKLDVSEQTVANYKFDFIARLKKLVRREDLPREYFPELY